MLGRRFKASGGTVEADVPLLEHDSHPQLLDTLSQLLQSYMSVVQLSNSKVYNLKHIAVIVTRDGHLSDHAIGKRFGSGKKAPDQLGISPEDWDDLHKICNDYGLFQDRHRGSSYPSLRSATDEELGLARKVAGDIIERYIAYLERTCAP